MSGNKKWVWAIVAGLTLIGLVARFFMFKVPAVGDELSTLWIIRGNGLFGVVSTVYSDAEITPPVSFILSKFSSWIFGQTPEGVRVPALLAGVLMVPLFYLVGLKTIGRRGALYATAIAAVSPFLVYYSGLARAYSIMLLLLLVATWFLLEATSERGRTWHWLGWVLAGCLAVYTHYTAVLLLAGQLIWVLWFFPALRLKAILYTGLMFLLFAPWLGGVKADFDSPTSYIMEQIQGSKREALEQLFFLRIIIDQPNYFHRWDTMLGTAGFLIALVAVVVAFARGRLPRPSDERWRGIWLAGCMFLAIFAGQLFLLAIGNDIFGSRNLAVTWIAIPLLLGALAVAAGRVWGVVAMVLILAGYVYSTVWIVQPAHSTFNFEKAAREIESTEGEGGTVLNAAFLSPAPLAALDGYLNTTLPRFNLTNLRDERDYVDHIFEPYDAQGITDAAFDTDGPVRLLTVADERTPVVHGDGSITFVVDATPLDVPRGWRIESQEEWPGLKPLVLTTLVRDARPPQN